MRAQSLFDYTFSLTLFITVTFVVVLLISNFYSDLQGKISSILSKTRALAISNQIIYLNSNFSENKILGLNSGKYNEINSAELLKFVNYCNNNKEEIKKMFLAKEFKLNISSYSCYSLHNIPTIKRIVVLNNQIEVLEFGVIV